MERQFFVLFILAMIISFLLYYSQQEGNDTWFYPSINGNESTTRCINLDKTDLLSSLYGTLKPNTIIGKRTMGKKVIKAKASVFTKIAFTPCWLLYCILGYKVSSTVKNETVLFLVLPKNYPCFISPAIWNNCNPLNRQVTENQQNMTKIWKSLIYLTVKVFIFIVSDNIFFIAIVLSKYITNFNERLYGWSFDLQNYSKKNMVTCL